MNECIYNYINGETGNSIYQCGNRKWESEKMDECGEEGIEWSMFDHLPYICLLFDFLVASKY